MPALDPVACEPKTPPIPTRDAFVAAYCAWRDLPREHAGKMYDLLAEEYPRALADWAGQFMEVHHGRA